MREGGGCGGEGEGASGFGWERGRLEVAKKRGGGRAGEDERAFDDANA